MISGVLGESDEIEGEAGDADEHARDTEPSPELRVPVSKRTERTGSDADVDPVLVQVVSLAQVSSPSRAAAPDSSAFVVGPRPWIAVSSWRARANM